MPERDGAGGPAADAGSPGARLAGEGLSPDERAEPERLRAEAAKRRAEAARARRRKFGWRTPAASALIGAGLGAAASVLVLAAGLAIFRSVLPGSLPAGVSAPAAGDSYDIVVRFIRDGLRLVTAVGLIVAAGVFFTGPSATAVRTRQALKKGPGWLRASGENAGLRTGPASRRTYARRKGLRISAVALAAVIFVLWSQPSGLAALVTALILLVVPGLSELIGRPPAAPAAGHHAGP